MKIVLIIFVYFSFALGLSAQAIVENPEKPPAKSAGRVVRLEEVLKISDEGTNRYYFKYPRSLRIAPDDSIFIQDENQILHFHKDGRFVRNYFKKGQGPGEMSYAGNILFTDNNIILQNSSPNKILWFDDDGRFIKDFAIRQKTGSLLQLLLFLNDVYYFTEWEFPRVKGELDYVDVPYNLLGIRGNMEALKSLTSFPVKNYVMASPGAGGRIYEIAVFIAVPYQAKFLVISHTSEYLLKLYDPEKNQVIRAFTRSYKRVKSQSPSEESKIARAQDDAKPPQKYMNDIVNIYTHKDAIWVATSTSDKNKGVLIDVFNFEGSFIDNFYLKAPEKARINFSRGRTESTAVSGNYFYAIEKNENGTFTIKKYEIGQ